jgi:hypothetical protein
MRRQSRLRRRWSRDRIFELITIALDPDEEIGVTSPPGMGEFATMFWDRIADQSLSVRVSRARKAE